MQFNNTVSGQSSTAKVFDNTDLFRYLSSFLIGEKVLSHNLGGLISKKSCCLPHFLPLLLTFRAAKEIVSQRLMFFAAADYVSSVSLVKFAIKMGYDFNRNCEILYHHAAAGEYIEVLDWVITLNEKNPESFGLPGLTTIAVAASAGKLAVLKFLRFRMDDFEDKIERFTCINGITFWNHQVKTNPAASAAFNGHLHILKWLRKLDESYKWNSEVLFSAICSDNLDMILWILEEELLDLSEEEESKACALAAQFGDIAALMLLLLEGKFESDERCGYAAAAFGHLHVLKWLKEYSICDFDEVTIAAAVSDIHDPDIRDLLFEDEGFVCDPSLVSDAMKGTGEKIKKGAEEKIITICEFLLSGDQPCPVDELVSYCTVKSGKLQLFDWLRERVVCPWHELCAVHAVRCGKLDLLQHIMSLNPPCPLTVDATAQAAENLDLTILEWLRSRDPPCPWDESCWISLLKANTDQENEDILAFMKRQNPLCPWSNEVVTEATKCSEGDDCEILKLFRSLDPTLQWETKCWYYPVRYGNFKTLNYLRSQGPLCPWDSSVCNYAALFLNMESLKWLRSQDPPCPIDLQEDHMRSKDVDEEIVELINNL